MRHSVWRLGPRDAPDLRRYAVRIAQRWGWLFLLVPLLLFGPSVVLVFGFDAVLCWPFALVLVLLTSRKLAPRMAALKPDELSPLLPDPAPARLFRHPVEYLNGFLLVGRDDIAFSFVEGWLIGQGVRSDFALRWKDVAAIDVPVHGVGVLYLKNGQRIRLHDLHVYAREALIEWHEARIPVAGEPTLPPYAVEPRQMLKAQVRTMADVILVSLAIPSAVLAWSAENGVGFTLAGGVALWALIRLGLDVNDLIRYRSILRAADRRAAAS